jgi:hypothetical protein
MQTSVAVALAWPETLCKQAGAWYDTPASFFGVSKNHFYKVGHAAIVIIQPQTGKCQYFDFGRYHAPFGRGRVRCEQTDHELKLATKAILDKNHNILNLQDLLNEIQYKPACHGEGKVYGSAVKVYYQKAIHRAKAMQDKETITYGPFVPHGTNCSRFVRSVLFNSVTSRALKLKLTFPRTLSPSPIGILKTLKNINTSSQPYKTKAYWTKAS